MLVNLPLRAVFLERQRTSRRDIPAEESVLFIRRGRSCCAPPSSDWCSAATTAGRPGTGTFMILGFTALLSLDLITAGGCAKASNLASCAASAVVWILHGQVLWALAIPPRVQHRRQLSRRALRHPRRQQEDPQRDVSGAGAAVREDAL